MSQDDFIICRALVVDHTRHKRGGTNFRRLTVTFLPDEKSRVFFGASNKRLALVNKL